jgi:hypothetical protein
MKDGAGLFRIRTLQTYAMGLNEKLIVTSVFFMVTMAFGLLMFVRVYMHHSDSAMFIELVENTARYGLPLTQINASINDAVWTWFATATEVCNADLSSPPHAYFGDSINQLRRHAYIIAYPLSVLTLLLPGMQVLPFAQAATFTGMLLVVYILLRRYGVGPAGALLFTAAVSCHPVWGQGLGSNLYADRYYILLGLIYVAVLHAALTEAGKEFNSAKLALIVGLGLLAGITHERGLLMTGMVTVGVAVLYWERLGGRRYGVPLAFFGLAMVGAMTAYMKLFNENPELRNFALSLLDYPILMVTNDNLRNGSISFVILNIALFGSAALFDWRLAVIAMGSMLPNLLFNNGGGEKYNWALHYHSFYFPFLVFAVLVGFCRLWASVSSPARIGISILVLVASAGMATFTAITPRDFDYRNIYNTAWYHAYDLFKFGRNSSWAVFAHEKMIIAAEVPQNTVVMTVESMMPVLASGRKLTYFPMGIEKADYAVLESATTADGQRYFVAPNHSGYMEPISLCMTQRMLQAGWDIDNATQAGQFKWNWIVRRKPSVP